MFDPKDWSVKNNDRLETEPSHKERKKRYQPGDKINGKRPRVWWNNGIVSWHVLLDAGRPGPEWFPGHLSKVNSFP